MSRQNIERLPSGGVAAPRLEKTRGSSKPADVAVDLIRSIEPPSSMDALRHSIRRLLFGDKPLEENSFAELFFGPTDAAAEEETRHEHVERWRALFTALAVESGGIDMNTFKGLLTAAKDGKEPTSDELAARFAEADVDRRGHIDFVRFMYGKDAVDSAVRKLVTIDDEALAKLEAATKADDQRLAEEVRQLLRLLGEMNQKPLPAMLHALVETRLTVELASSAYSMVGALGEQLAQLRSVHGQLQRLPDKVKLGLSLTDSLPLMAAPRSRRSTGGRWARISPFLPSVHEIDLYVSMLQFCGLAYLLQQRLSQQRGDERTLGPLVSWERVLGWTSLLTIDLESLSLWASSVDLPDIAGAASAPSYTSLYVSVACAIPILVSFSLLSNFRAMFKVLWLFGCCLSAALVFAALVALLALKEDRLLVNSQGLLSVSKLRIFLGVSCGALGLHVVLLGGYMLHRFWAANRSLRARIADYEQGRPLARAKADKAPSKALLGSATASAEQPPSRLVLARNLFLASCLLVFAQLDEYTSDEALFEMGVALSVLLNLLAICGFGYVGLSLSEWGRARIGEAWFLYQQNVVPGLILLLSLLFVPVTRQVLSVWYPFEVTCEAGTRFPQFPATSLSAGDKLQAGDVVCEPCRFFGEFVTGGPCSARFCPEQRQTLSPYDIRFSYEGIILPFFGPASILTLLAFTVGVPLFFYKVVQTHTELFERFGVSKERAGAYKSEALFAEVTWRYRMACTRNRASTLYAPFKLAWRRAYVGLVCQKLLVAFISAFFTDVPIVGLCLLGALHLCAMVFWLVAAPFVELKTVSFAAWLSLASALNALITPVAVAAGIASGQKDATTAFIVLVTFLIPAVILLVLAYPSERLKRRRDAETDKFESGYTQEAVNSLEKRLALLDKDLDRATHKLVLFVVTALAIAAFWSISLMLLVKFKQIESSNVVAPTPLTLGAQLQAEEYPICEIEELVIRSEFAGYADWQSFTDNCCCSERETEEAFGADAVSFRTELWTCSNGYLKERKRIDDRSVRDFCRLVFKPDFGLPVFDSSLLALAVRNTATNMTVVSGKGW